MKPDELEIEEKRRVFDEYQAKLDMRRQALVERPLGRARPFRKWQGRRVDMVLDYQVVSTEDGI